MILRYDDGTSVRDWNVHPGKLLSPEVEAIEDVGASGWDTFDEWGQKFMKGNRRAYRALLWILLKRENPTLKFNEVSFSPDSVTWDFDAGEKEKVIDAINAAGEELDEAQRHTLTEVLGGLAGKDSGNRSETSDESTDSVSPNDSTPV